MPESDKELADRLDAWERLEVRGYKRETCEHCGGSGQRMPEINCWHCGGRGYYWQAPIEKENK